MYCNVKCDHLSIHVHLQMAMAVVLIVESCYHKIVMGYAVRLPTMNELE